MRLWRRRRLSTVRIEWDDGRSQEYQLDAGHTLVLSLSDSVIVRPQS